MTPDIKKTTKNQHLITLLLILVLVSIVAGYIYYGMMIAKQADTVTQEVIEAPVVVSDDEQRQEIIDALKQEAPVLADEKRTAIIDDLRKPANQPSSEDAASRAAILEALQQN